MQEHMSAEEYRRTIVAPATGEDIFPEISDENLFGAAKVSQDKKVGDKFNIPKLGLPQPTEHELQSVILERLKFAHRGFFWRENSGLMAVESNGKKRMFRAGITGIADIMGVFQGFPVAIEVKRPGKKPSHEQLAFKQRFEECGGIYVVCTDPALVMGQLNAAMAAKKGE